MFKVNTLSLLHLTKALSFAVGNSDRFISAGKLMREILTIDLTNCVNVMSKISYYALTTHHKYKKL